jgi:hypothetical protein
VARRQPDTGGSGVLARRHPPAGDPTTEAAEWSGPASCDMLNDVLTTAERETAVRAPGPAPAAPLVAAA